MADLKTNALYYGDNLRILREYVPDESIDLIYLDPPFNSNRSYNVLFRETSSAASQARSRHLKTRGTGARLPRRRSKTSPYTAATTRRGS